MSIVTFAYQKRMTSREIAGLTGKEHAHVKRDIENMLNELGEATEGYLQNWIDPQNKQTYQEFAIDRELTETLLTGYSAVLRRKVIARWRELEQEAATPAATLPQTYIQALESLLASKKSELLAIEQRDIAIATKAQIGTSREATAMATASNAVRKVNQLQVELDKSHEYATVKRMEMLYHGQRFKWRLLKSAAADLGIPPVDVFDANYGTVKSYHADVWMEAFALPIDAIATANTAQAATN